MGFQFVQTSVAFGQNAYVVTVNQPVFAMGATFGLY